MSEAPVIGRDRVITVGKPGKRSSNIGLKTQVHCNTRTVSAFSGRSLCKRWRACLAVSCDKKSGVPWDVLFLELGRAIEMMRASQNSPIRCTSPTSTVSDEAMCKDVSSNFAYARLVDQCSHCFRLRSWLTSHRQNDAELRLATYHTRITLGRLFKRIGFNHGTHTA